MSIKNNIALVIIKTVKKGAFFPRLDVFDDVIMCTEHPACQHVSSWLENIISSFIFMISCVLLFIAFFYETYIGISPEQRFYIYIYIERERAREE